MIIKDGIAYPDATDQRWLRLFTGAAVITAFVLFCWLCWRLSSLQTPEDAHFVISAIAVATFTLAAAIWTWVCFVFRQVIRSDQWPHPGARIDRPVAILRGRSARIRGWCLLALGSLLLVICVAIAGYLHFSAGARIEKLMESQSQGSRQVTCVELVNVRSLARNHRETSWHFQSCSSISPVQTAQS